MDFRMTQEAESKERWDDDAGTIYSGNDDGTILYHSLPRLAARISLGGPPEALPMDRTTTCGVFQPVTGKNALPNMILA